MDVGGEMYRGRSENAGDTKKNGPLGHFFAR